MKLTVTKNDQIKALIEWLDRPEREEETVEEVAKQIVTAFYGLLTKDLKEEPPNLKVGVAFKDAISNKTYHVAWSDGDLFWIVTADSRYGYLGTIERWKPYATESKAKAGAPGSNVDGYEVDERLMETYTKKKYTILQVADKCVLMLEDDMSRPIVEPNDHLAKFYKRKKPSVKLF